jgi:hypothetical protein
MVPSIAGLADEMSSMQTEIEGRQELLKRQLLEQAIVTAGAQIGVTIALMSIPVAGWITAALTSIYSAITALYGQFVQRKIKREGDDLKDRINAYMKLKYKEIELAENKVVDDVFDDAQRLAKSGIDLNDGSDLGVGAATGSVVLAAEDGMPVSSNEAPIEWVAKPQSGPIHNPGVNGWDEVISPDGSRYLIGPPEQFTIDIGPVGVGTLDEQMNLGDFMSKVDTSVRRYLQSIDKKIRRVPVVKKSIPTIQRVVKGAARVWAEMYVRPIMLVGRVVFGGTAAVMRATGDRKGAEQWRKLDRQLDRRARHHMRSFSNMFGTAKDFKAGIMRSWRSFTGEQALISARTKMGEIEQMAMFWIDQFVKRAIDKVLSPEGRAEIRLALARALRGDPYAREGYEYIRRREARGLATMWDQNGEASRAAGGEIDPSMPSEMINLNPPQSSLSFAIPVAAAAGAAFLILQPA